MSSNIQLHSVIVRFSNCKFTYSSLDFVYPDYLKGEKSKKSKAKKWINKLNPNHSTKMTFENCVFNPKDEKPIKKLFEKVAAVQFSFRNCIFVRRRTSIVEKVNYFVRKYIGFCFTVDLAMHRTTTITVDRNVFRLKDIPKTVFEYIIARIQEE